MVVLKHILVIVLLATLSWTRAFTFFTKPVFGIQLNRRIASCRSTGAGRFQKSIERAIPMYCQQESAATEGGHDGSELASENPPDGEPVLLADVSLEEKQAELTKELHEWENKLRLERIKLNNLEDKLSESGKNGYYLVQAQLQDFRVNYAPLKLQQRFLSRKLLHTLY